MRVRVAILLGLMFGHGFGLLLIPQVAQAVSGGVFISELQTGGATVGGVSKAGDEFVELYNATGNAAVLNGWSLQYRSASAGSDCTKGWPVTPPTKPTITTSTIASHGFYLLGAGGTTGFDASFTSGLAATGGTIRILDGSGETVDALAWGGAYCGRGTAALAPAAGQSLERRPGADIENGGNAYDTGDNAADFNLRSIPQPQNTKSALEAPIDYPVSASEATEPTPVVYAPLQLSELLIDPISPQTDNADEFVEIHNPTTEPVQAEGYTISTGDHQYHLPAGVIAPDGYIVVTSGSSTISLVNSGGVASLLDPTGVVIDTAAAWGPAVPGASWAYFSDTNTWQWTLTPTPNVANALTPLTPTVEPGLGGFASVELNELLPDPAAPSTDANDEFIELYNPNADAVDLTGYTLKTGSTLSATYTIGSLTIPAQGYLALTSATTGVALANDGSSVALYDPAGSQLGTTITYAKAVTGSAWARFDDGWSWTTQPTPSAPNIAADPAVLAATTAAAKAAKAKAAAAKVAPKTTKAAAVKASPKPKAVKAVAKSTRPLVAAATSPGGRWLLFILAALTIGYVIYEFRYDLRDFYFRLRGHPKAGGTPSQSADRRGSDRAGERLGGREDNLRPGLGARPRIQW